ncbi:anion permease [Bdellovibrio sp. SKB1291214]|uniref:anion permease n=1 Tax=Bdellovibrio sp. SKB1291214 TaxID=1732569 RepID=UPI000B623A54|nr:anion permease [Bdellovibrio sp. SKB1291214]UYL08044.1 anion permease [Bdellovibrio sp. SKB1291214]
MNKDQEMNYKAWLAVLILGGLIWITPPPEGLKEGAWQLFAIFISAIFGIVIKAATMGSISMISMALVAALQLRAPGDISQSVKLALSGFGNGTIWMITIAFFISRGFIKTGLGRRIAYWFIVKLGGTPLGIAYGLTFSDLVLAPATPSNTARAGGILMPIMKSIAMGFGSDPADPKTHRRMGAYLTLNSYYANLLGAAMFITGTASNSMCQKFAKDLGVEISWGGWAMAALVPGVVSLALTPWLLFKIYPPELRDTKSVQQETKKKLADLGAVTRNEWLMVLAFVMLLVMWIFGPQLKIDATVGAMVGLSFLLLSGVLTWEDVKGEKGAWDTMVWFSALVMMAEGLNQLGFVSWFSGLVKAELGLLPWYWAFPAVVLVYFYTRYLFASATAHVAAMYSAMLAVAIAVGIEGKLAALMLGFAGSLSGVLTHYAHGPAPILYGVGYVDLKDWWKIGFIFSIVYIIIWMGLGAAWWKVLGIY